MGSYINFYLGKNEATMQPWQLLDRFNELCIKTIVMIF